MSDKIQINDITYILRNRKSGFSIMNVFMPIIEHLHYKSYEAPCEKANLFGMIKNLLWVRKIASHNGINHMTGGPHYFLLAIPFRKNILTIHDLVLLHNSKGLKHWLFKWLWFKLPIMCSRKITCITETVRQDLLKTIHVDERKVVTIYNPVSPLFRPSQHDFNSTCPRILHIGTAWNKNTVRMISALKGIPCKIVIVGEQNEDITSALKQTNADYEVLYNLTNEELYHQYKLADIISFPSIFEGFGMPIIEGQATGRPVLCSNISPMTEVAGDGACLINPHDINQIRNGFLHIINDEDYRNGLVRKGYENVKRFSIEHISEQYMNIYKNTCKKY